jgi:hypothetical protein
VIQPLALHQQLLVVLLLLLLGSALPLQLEALHGSLGCCQGRRQMRRPAFRLLAGHLGCRYRAQLASGAGV